MTDRAPLVDRFLAWADSFVPEDRDEDLELVRRTRVALAQVALGIPFAIGMCALYAAMGSPLAAASTSAIVLGLGGLPIALRAGASVTTAANGALALTYVATLGVTLRTGGLESPAVVWMFLLPLAVYAVSGRGSAIAWAVLAALALVVLQLAAASGVRIANDLTPRELGVLRLLGDACVLLATVLLLLVLDAARLAAIRAREAAERALDRQRILDDMHDGVGSHLLGLLVEARAGKLDETRLVTGLESSLDDLRLIVDSLDPLHDSLDAALGALRARLASRCESVGSELAWDADATLVASLDPASAMQVLRALQEMVTNAVRHAAATRVEVRIARDLAPPAAGPVFRVEVRDDGRGFPDAPTGAGRGMKSLRTRARKLGGTLTVERAEPGTRVAIVAPLPEALRAPP